MKMTEYCKIMFRHFERTKPNTFTTVRLTASERVHIHDALNAYARTIDHDGTVPIVEEIADLFRTS